VTADGGNRTVSADTDPELDWALRGAGHNFGIVDRFTFRLHPISHVYGGYVAYSGSELVEATRLFRDVMLQAPDDLTCTLLLERYGPTQSPTAVISVAYCGDDVEYRDTLEKNLRSLTVVDWQFEWRTYVSMQMCLGRLPFGLRHYWSARTVDDLPDELADALVDRFLAGSCVDPFNDTVLVEPVHGAVRRVSPADSAVPFRTARFNITGMAIWTPAGADDEQTAWARSVSAAAAPYGSGGDGYVNYVSDANYGNASDVANRAVRTYGADAYARLVALKRRLDPDNFFRSNYNLG
jgi:FAD/FMN-containing dehydrogenase